MPATPTIQRPTFGPFHGLNNVLDPIELDASWLQTADNCDLTEYGELTQPRGYALSLAGTNIVGSFETVDMQRLYVIDNGTLLQILPDFSAIPLKSGLSLDPYHHVEVNGVIYYTNGTDFGSIEVGGWRPWGIQAPVPPVVAVTTGNLNAGLYRVCLTAVDDRGMESSNSEVLTVPVEAGAQLSITVPTLSGYSINVYCTEPNGNVFMLAVENAAGTVSYNGQRLRRRIKWWFTDLPRGSLPALLEGQIYCAEWFPSLDMSVIWRSAPLAFHHFNPGRDGIIVPGEVRMLASVTETKFAGTERLTQRGTAAAMIIGTDRQIFSWSGGSGFKSPENQLVLLANYGVVPGWHAREYHGKLFFWTLRGACTALPFQNLTEDTISVAPGLSAGGTVVERDGMKRYVVALVKGGDAYNRRAA